MDMDEVLVTQRAHMQIFLTKGRCSVIFRTTCGGLICNNLELPEMLRLRRAITTAVYNDRNDVVLTNKNDVVLSKKISKQISPKSDSPVSRVSLLPRCEPEREEANQKEIPASRAYSSIATTLGVPPAVGAQLSRVW